MYMSDEFPDKKKTSSVRKFHRDKIIPRLRSVSFLHKRNQKPENEELQMVN